MRGQCVRSGNRQLIGEEDAFLWLSRGYLKGGTECEIRASQDLVLRAKYHAPKILQTETDSNCRLFKQFDQAAEKKHII